MGPHGDVALTASSVVGHRATREAGAPGERRPTRTRETRAFVRAAIAAGVLAGAAAIVCAPVRLCFFAIVWHLPCPGCGMTRALLAILGGDLHRALALNPLAPIVAPWAACAVARHAVAYVRTGDPWRTARTRTGERLAAGVVVVLLLASWTARFFGFLGGPVPV